MNMDKKRTRFIASLPFAFIEWQSDDLRCRVFSTDVDLNWFAWDGILDSDVAHADIFVEGGAGRAAGQCADLLPVVVDGVAAPTNAAINHFNANELTFQTLFFGSGKCVVSNKIPFGEFDRPAQASF